MTTKNTRRDFTDEFKREAVSLLRGSRRPLTQVAAELGLQPSVLRRWRGPVDEARSGATVNRPIAAVLASADQLEIRRLRKELERAQRERGILRQSDQGIRGQDERSGNTQRPYRDQRQPNQSSRGPGYDPGAGPSPSSPASRY